MEQLKKWKIFDIMLDLSTIVQNSITFVPLRSYPEA